MGGTLVQAIVLVTDLHDARRRMESLGFTVIDGGHHPGRGTANMIVPFGEQYLELLAVVDEAEARSSPQGQPVVAALARRGPGLARWSVEPDDIEAAALRLGHPVERRQRIRPDGTVVTWRSVAVDAAWREPWRCAFMAWDDPTRTRVTHRNGATGFARLAIMVPDLLALQGWLAGPIPARLAVETGSQPGVTALSVSSPSGDIPVG